MKAKLNLHIYLYNIIAHKLYEKTKIINNYSKFVASVVLEELLLGEDPFVFWRLLTVSGRGFGFGAGCSKASNSSSVNIPLYHSALQQYKIYLSL